jgi:hypothetical protein
MINVFCTKKLESFVKTEDSTLESYTSDNNWNGQLISIDRRKCLYFIHKRTLYSILLLDILKKDLMHLEKLFFEGLVNQLKLDRLYSPKLDNYLLNNYSTIKLFRTDNDQKTLGTMRDDIMHLNAYIEDKPDKMIAANYHMRKTLNIIPIGTRKYQNARDLMELELKNILLQQI